MFKKIGLAKASLITGGALAVASVTAIGAHAAASPLNLGKAKNYAVLAAGGITNTGQSTLNGNLGLSPVISYIDTGLLTTNGDYHFGDTASVTAQADSVALYTQSTLETPSVTVASELAGQTLLSGIYSNPAGLSVNGSLNLDAQNNPNALFIIQTPASLTTGAASHINLLNGAQACNVFWQIGSGSALGAGSDFKGNILGRGNFVSNAGSVVSGRILISQGSVALNSTTITIPGCNVVPPAAVITNLGKGFGTYTFQNGNANFTFDVSATAQGAVFVNSNGRISWNVANGWKFDGNISGYSFVNGVSTMTGNGYLSYFSTGAPALGAPSLGTPSLGTPSLGTPSFSSSNRKEKHGNDNDNDGDDHGKKNGKNKVQARWINATTGAVNFTVTFTRAINPNGTAGKVNAFAIGFAGTPAAGVPALPALGAVVPVRN